ncbi:unnamed protein product [Soboliphyme baturini]|uniref:CAP-Gly domain-containing protein n=1 Tax=Soboliphyme baturini TaxID=241478 RepID=A0A183J5U8_9BILA|nr:unnamed protein product [Soboliphyme baturini]
MCIELFSKSRTDPANDAIEIKCGYVIGIVRKPGDQIVPDLRADVPLVHVIGKIGVIGQCFAEWTDGERKFGRFGKADQKLIIAFASSGRVRPRAPGEGEVECTARTHDRWLNEEQQQEEEEEEDTEKLPLPDVCFVPTTRRLIDERLGQLARRPPSAPAWGQRPHPHRPDIIAFGHQPSPFRLDGPLIASAKVLFYRSFPQIKSVISDRQVCLLLDSRHQLDALTQLQHALSFRSSEVSSEDIFSSGVSRIRSFPKSRICWKVILKIISFSPWSLHSWLQVPLPHSFEYHRSQSKTRVT